ncbi:AAA family ATPase [Phyllobacterium phragmitis]|uniref:AAA family ATPase n=1 Tax=Phyllobacterium phragmitis TaxID=2670329 RepID=A0A2S9IL63_9HYPH|nr:MoxR family ATPase [Phyllobacterium phragmitis]PRD41274.1 AAA family ATPase [Phyllobacterium phragmitis]
MHLARDVDTTLSDARGRAQALQQEVAKVILGQERVIQLLTIATFARGHVLLEGDVGVGKTTLLRAMARAIGGLFQRVEGTVDLMPGDLIYHAHLTKEGKPRIDPGPLLRSGNDLSIFFFNEINRARPQVHSLLLRLMAERSITAFDREFNFPFLQVFADRNRVEREETFELPAAARDRFFMEIEIPVPSDEATRRRLVFDPRFHDIDALIAEVGEGVLDFTELPFIARAIQSGVRTSEALEAYTVALWQAVRTPNRHGIEIEGVDMERLVFGGASPRGVSYLVRAARVRAWLEGREMVVPEDIRDVFVEVMAHRIFLDPVYELRREPIVRALCRAVFDKVPTP